MKLVRIDASSRVPAKAAMFVGDVFKQGLTEGLSQQLRVAVITFESGARNTFHTHEGDQVLIVTEGEGIVATESEERPVTAGDVIVFPAGERHWHGAQPGKSMTHLSIQSGT